MNVLRVTIASVIGDHRLSLAFDDGSRGIADLKTLLTGPIFEPLRDPVYFARATLDASSGTVAWPNGADFAPETLREALLVDGDPARPNADAVLRFAAGLEDTPLFTLARRAAFTARVVAGELEITPASSSQARRVSRDRIEQVCLTFASTGSLDAGKYHSITFDASYLMALIHRMMTLGNDSRVTAEAATTGRGIGTRQTSDRTAH